MFSSPPSPPHPAPKPTLRPTDNDLTERGYFLENNADDDSSQSLTFMEPLSNPHPTLVQAPSNKDILPISRELTDPIFNPSSNIVQISSGKKDESLIPTEIKSDYNQNSTAVKRNWQPSTVEDYEDTVTDIVTMFYPDSPLNNDSDVEQDGDKDEIELKTSGKVVLETLPLICEWPGCYMTLNQELMLTFNSCEELEQHYRSHHLVHEFGCSRIVATRGSATPLASLSTQKDANICLAFVLKNVPPHPATGKGIPVQVRPPANSEASEDSGRRVRFSMLPDSKRPEMTIPFHVEDVRSNSNFITPEPFEEPILPTISGRRT